MRLTPAGLARPPATIATRECVGRLFTGIVEELGTVDSIRSGSRSMVLAIKAREVLIGCKIGDSIAVNGVCLTVTTFSPNGFTADIMPETMNRSGLAQLKPGDRVNLERTMRADGRFGGHIVQGHIDGVGKIKSMVKDDNAVRVTIEAPLEVMRYIVQKGSVAIDGISLTVAGLSEKEFSVSLIPHTLSITTMGRRQPGDLVNLEADIVGKYVESFLDRRFGSPGGTEAGQGGLTIDFLKEHGF